MSIGRSSCGTAMFNPTPKITATVFGSSGSVTICARIPPSLRPWNTMSLGHLSLTSSMELSAFTGSGTHCRFVSCSVSRSASSTDSPAIICSQPLSVGLCATPAPTAEMNDAVNDPPGALNHVWSRRPRPAVCSRAAMTVMPLRSHWPLVMSCSAVAFVERAVLSDHTCATARVCGRSSLIRLPALSSPSCSLLHI